MPNLPLQICIGITLIDYPVFIGCWLVVIAFIVLNRSAKVNAPERVLIDKGEQVLLRDVPICRVLGVAGKFIHKSEIGEIKLSSVSVTLLDKSGKSFEVFVPKSVLTLLAEHAKQLFSYADYSEAS